MAEVAKVESRDQSPADKAKPENPAEDQPPQKVPAPTPVEKDVAAIESQVERKKRERDNAQQQRRHILSSMDSTKNELKEAREILTKIKAQGDSVKAERESLIKQRDTVREKIKSASNKGNNNKKAGGRPRLMNAEQINARIEELQFRQSTSTLSIQEEKAILKEISDLNAAKRHAEDAAKAKADAVKSSEGLKLQEDELTKMINEQSQTLKDIRQRQQAQYEIVTNLQKSTSNPLIRELSKKRDDLSKEISDLLGKKKEILDKFHTQRRAHNKYLAWVRQQRQKEREEAERVRRAREAEEKRQHLLQEAKRHPWEEEMEMCDMLTRYMKNLQPAPPTTNGGPKVGNKATLEHEGKQLRAIGKRGKRTDFDDFFQVKEDGAGKKKRKGRKGNKKLATLPHSLQTMRLFHELGIDPPSSVENLKDAITAVEEKKVFLETAPPRHDRAHRKGPNASMDDVATAPAAAAAGADEPSSGTLQSGDTVQTPYGGGTVQEVRDGNVVVVKMDRFESTAYLQATDVSRASAN